MIHHYSQSINRFGSVHHNTLQIVGLWFNQIIHFMGAHEYREKSLAYERAPNSRGGHHYPHR